MEVLAGEREIANNNVVLLSDNLAPFPDIISDDLNPTKSLEHGNNFQPPPQKLRPIRCNGSYQTPPPPTSSLHGTLSSCYAVKSPELGFLTTQNLNDDISASLPYTESATLGVGTGGLTELQQIKTELISEGHFLEAELSSTSEDVSGEPSETNKEGTSRKRKRKTRKSIALFMDKMMRKVMEKQEKMHKELMETLERREKERIMREEACNQQEIERAKRDEELRSQERARSLALIAFIENLLGLEIPIPESMVPASPSSMEKYEEGQDQDPTNKKRWPKSEIQALITVRSGLEEKFLKGPKSSVWEEVAISLCNMGYKRTAKKCKEKWENINKYYKRTTESGKKRPQNSKACPYFQELDLLYKSGFVASPNLSTNDKLAIEHSSTMSQ